MALLRACYSARDRLIVLLMARSGLRREPREALQVLGQAGRRGRQDVSGRAARRLALGGQEAGAREVLERYR